MSQIADNVEKVTVKKGKKASFGEVASIPPLAAMPKPEVQYNKCVVGFAMRVDKGQKLKENFDKKVGEALTFLRLHIDPEACFLPLNNNKNLRPFKEKLDLPKFQVTSQSYFNIPNQHAFSRVTQDGGRVVKGSGIMGFQGNPQKCLEEARGDL